jgi:hypothetical protein
MQDIDRAITETIHNSDISAKEIAEGTGKSHQVLLNKANPNNDTHHLTLHEAVAVIKLTGNTAILDALNSIFGYGEYARKPKTELLIDALLNAIKENADVSIAIRASVADGKLSATEKTEVLREIREAKDALIDLERSVQATEVGKALRVA